MVSLEWPIGHYKFKVARENVYVPKKSFMPKSKQSFKLKPKKSFMLKPKKTFMLESKKLFGIIMVSLQW